MTSIEQAWDRIRQDKARGGALRIDDSHRADFFAAEDDQGRVGLVLISIARPPSTPSLESIDVTLGQREDGRWSFGLWLTTTVLLTPFRQLCEDLIESSRDVEVERVPAFVITRLQGWHDLLESASGMSVSKLRGLVAELLILQTATGRFGPANALLAWVGPWEAPQDFTLPGLWIEVKATIPSARTVKITSADQLVAAGPLYLAISTLATLLPSDDGITSSGLLEDIERQLPGGRSGDLGNELARRLSALGYDRGAEYGNLPFRLESTRYYHVSDDFPRITPEDLDAGVAEVRYDLELGALGPFAAVSPFEA